MVRRRERLVPLVPKMEEPAKKKPKVDGEDESEEPDESDTDLCLLQKSLLGNCLCGLSEDVIYAPFHDPNQKNSEETEQKVNLTDWNQDRILQLLTSLQILCEVSIKQNVDGMMCSRISSVCDELVSNRSDMVEQIVTFLKHDNRFIGFTACKALSAFFIVCKSNVNIRWLETVTDFALEPQKPEVMTVSLDCIKRIIEWKDKSAHPLEARGPNAEIVSPTCNTTSLMESDSPDSTEIKCICIKVLETKWSALISKVDLLLSSYECQNEGAIITFFRLWESIISVKANLSVIDTKPFYTDLDNFVSVLHNSLPPDIWKHLLDLFNEVLCYGSTLALQDNLADEPCTILAHHVMRSVKDWRLLEMLPYRSGNGTFGGGEGQGDRPLLQKMVLLVLKSVAVTVKETRYDSSSDSSIGSEADDVVADMAVIERSIREVLRKVDVCVKQFLPFHPETPISQWVVQLFADQDDALIESMVCCLDVAVGTSSNTCLSPASTLIAFLHVVSHDTDVLLDLLVSNETCFLLYLLRVLKYMRRNWSEFVTASGRELADTMSVLIRLRITIDRLVKRALFPYNINPVMKLLEKCEELYDGC